MLLVITHHWNLETDNLLFLKCIAMYQTAVDGAVETLWTFIMLESISEILERTEACCVPSI